MSTKSDEKIIAHAARLDITPDAAMQAAAAFVEAGDVAYFNTAYAQHVAVVLVAELIREQQCNETLAALLQTVRLKLDTMQDAVRDATLCITGDL